MWSREANVKHREHRDPTSWETNVGIESAEIQKRRAPLQMIWGLGPHPYPNWETYFKDAKRRGPKRADSTTLTGWMWPPHLGSERHELRVQKLKQAASWWTTVAELAAQRTENGGRTSPPQLGIEGSQSSAQRFKKGVDQHFKWDTKVVTGGTLPELGRKDKKKIQKGRASRPQWVDKRKGADVSAAI